MRAVASLLVMAWLLPHATGVLAPGEPLLVVVPPGGEGEARARGGAVILDASQAGFLLVSLPVAPATLPTGWYAAWDHVATAASLEGDPLRADQWALDALGVEAAWAREEGDAAVVTAVVDSGVRASHEDLAGARVVAGADLVELDPWPDDESGHGTLVAGVLVASRGNGRGIAGMGAFTVLAIRVLDENNRAPCARVAAGIVAAVEQGADVINLSLSCSSDDPALRLAVDHAARRGVLVVAAAGNLHATRPQDCVTYPARLPGVLAVGAVDASLAAAPFSCRGDALDLVAPGVDVLSTSLAGYAFVSGTSVAAPHVAAAAALLKSASPEATAEEIRGRLLGTARDLGATGWDSQTGRGLVQPAAALVDMAE